MKFRAWGLTVASAWPVTGGMAIPKGDPGWTAAPDIEVVAGPVARRDDAEGPGRHGRTLALEVRGIARFDCDGGRRVVVTPVSGAREYELLGSLVATALPATLWMRGELVLHAAAALLPGTNRAVAIAGPSGSGKSTVMVELVADGARVVGDDTVCARLAGRMATVSGLPAALMSPRTSQALREERAILRVPAERQVASSELGALVVLDVGPGSSGIGFTPLKGAAALEAILRNRHRPWVPRHLRSDGAVLPRLAALLERIAVYSWNRRAGAPGLDDREKDFLGRCAEAQRLTAADDEGSDPCPS